ncbi:MAG: peptidylprolyl isomerase [Pseudomonadota bacterium]|nr:peptidylprolyl isomerase [Pseudomonadota bacterium]
MLLRIIMFVLLFVVITLNRSNVIAAEDPIVAVVNGSEIRFSQVQAAHKRLPKKFQRIPIEEILPSLVDSLIDTHLAAAKAMQEKLDKTTEFKLQMEWIKKQVLQELILDKVLKAKVKDVNLLQLYKKEVQKLSTAEQIQASHILLKTEKEANDVISLLKKGSNFAELAKNQSIGPSASNGGDLGFFGPGQMVPEFEKAAYKLKPGTHTKKAVKTQFGWHVIKVVKRKKIEVPNFESMKSKLRNTLLQERVAAFIKGLRKGSKITLFNLDGTSRKQIEN